PLPASPPGKRVQRYGSFSKPQNFFSSFFQLFLVHHEHTPHYQHIAKGKIIQAKISPSHTPYYIYKGKKWSYERKTRKKSRKL
ncbi:MAG: hypothetical protein IJR56_03195, partial [Bacteroidaceae bacterium]|nr:hypothetical protein [Bacteroidaceae bacterium]